MSLFNKLVEKIDVFQAKRKLNVSNSVSLSELNSFFQSRAAGYTGTDLSEITYFTCLKVLSEALGKLSIHLHDGENNRITTHDSYRAVKVRPNKYMTPFNFKVLMEYSRNHYGNAYAFIKHDAAGKLEGLYPLDSRQVQMWVADTPDFTSRAFFYRYFDPKGGRNYWLNPSDVLHLKGGLSQDGLVGMCVREVLARNMEGNKAAQGFLNDLYQKGLTASAVVKFVGDLSKEKKESLVKELSGFRGAGGDRIIPLPLGFDIVPLDLKLTDSQFYELKKFSSLQVAAAFGIKPNHLNNYDKSSYSNSEMQNLTFYVDTLLAILTQWEEELNYKLLTNEEIEQGLSYQFNVGTILRGDIKTQSESLRNYVSGSIYTINEARKKAGLPPAPGGDVIVVNGSYTDLDKLGNAYAKGGE